MEGKEQHNEEEDFDPKSKKEEEDADDFGLPEIEESESDAETISDPVPESWEDKPEEDTFSNDTFGESAGETSESEYVYDEDPVTGEEEEYKSSYYEEEYGQKKSPVGWIVFGVLALILIIAAVIWFMKGEPEPAPVVVAPKVVEEVIEEPEPVVEEVTVVEEVAQQPGVYEINQPTGRYYVIVASSVDFDLVHDYAEKLAKKGMVCEILAPRGNKLFHRLSVANYVSLNDASLKSEQLKSSMGEGVWVIRY
jgi:hypothetical protein